MENHQGGSDKPEGSRGPQITGVGGRNKYTRPKTAASLSREQPGRGERGGGGPGRSSRGRGGLSSSGGARAVTYGPTTVANSRGNKWVSSSKRNDCVVDQTNYSHSDVSATAQIESATSAAPVGVVATAVDSQNSNFEKRGNHKLVMKRKAEPLNNSLVVSANESYSHAETHVPTTVANGRGDKWVSSSKRNDSVVDQMNYSNSDVSATVQIESATSAAPVGDVATAVDNQTYNFEKRGNHKLVMKRKAEPSNNALIVSATQINYLHRKANGSNDPASLSKLLSPMAMGDRHPAKAVANANAEAENITSRAAMDRSISRMVDRGQIVKVSCEASSSKYFPEKSRSWIRKRSNDTTKDSKSIAAEELSTRDPVEFAVQNVSLQRKRNNQAPPTGPRRINLLKNSTANDDLRDLSGVKYKREVDGINENMIESNRSSISTDRKILTDFRYQDAGRGRGRGRGLSSTCGGGSTGGRNMGLVRVKHIDEDAICATFLRGLQCSNPKCTMRHDVATEVLRPVCVFFQRNGMCNKGEGCPFRHVKVRWDAEKGKIR